MFFSSKKKKKLSVHRSSVFLRVNRGMKSVRMEERVRKPYLAGEEERGPGHAQAGGKPWRTCLSPLYFHGKGRR